jgi:protein-tyrosine phosphatase
VIPLVDTHCHLLSGLDDGPRTFEESLEMCRVAWEGGTRVIAATAHQSESHAEVTPERIRQAAWRLSQHLSAVGPPLTVYPCGEVMIRPDLEDLWIGGKLLGMAGGNRYLLMELPCGLYFELGELIGRLIELGVHPILAHPERHPDLLHGQDAMERIVRTGCLMQVSADSITSTRRQDVQVLKRWVREGLVHMIGSDGHSARHRPPEMAAAHRQIEGWAGQHTADRLCSINGLIVLEGLPFKAAERKPARRRWFSAMAERIRGV